MLRLIQALEQKRNDNTWTDTLIVEESNTAYHPPLA